MKVLIGRCYSSVVRTMDTYIYICTFLIYFKAVVFKMTVLDFTLQVVSPLKPKYSYIFFTSLEYTISLFSSLNSVTL